MMAVSTPMAESSKTKESAIANGVASPWVMTPSTSARAMPIDTAVTATAVDGATLRRRRLTDLDPRDQSSSGHVNLHESARNLSRPSAAPVRPDLGEGFGE
jgi:hypothetical protein